MMQESVYVKLCLNHSVVDSAMKSLKKRINQTGTCAGSHHNRKAICFHGILGWGERKTEYLDSDERLVIL